MAFDETTNELIRQVKIDLRFLQRAVDALEDKYPTPELALIRRKVSDWLDSFFVDPKSPCPACMQPEALMELCDKEC